MTAISNEEVIYKDVEEANDFEVGNRRKLERIKVINLDGTRMKMHECLMN